MAAASMNYKTLGTGLDILKLIIDYPGITQSMIIKSTGLHESTVSRILSDLATALLIQKNGCQNFPGEIFQKYNLSTL